MRILTVVAAVFAVYAAAAYPAGIVWEYSTNGVGQATITGASGAVEGDVEIPDSLDGYPVTGIGDMVFLVCSGLTRVTIPDSVTNIGYCAFYYCSALTNVTLGASVTNIDNYAFYACFNLTGITIPASVKNIGYCAFDYCPVLAAIDFEGQPPSGLTDSYIPLGVHARYNGLFSDEWATLVNDGWREHMEPYYPWGGVEVNPAAQRYPWNGKVDVEVEVLGLADRNYIVSLAGEDLTGASNLTVRTAWRAGRESVTNTVFMLKPGRYRFVWDADADIGTDFDFASVAIRAAVKPMARRMLTLEANDAWAPAVALTNVPTLVRLSTAIDGFDYNDFVSPTNGADLSFLDENGTALPHEIDEWNTNGVSLVWVRLPELRQGTRFTAVWGGNSLIPDAADRIAARQAVWADYAGVWHMNEPNGIAYDSTAYGGHAVPTLGTNVASDISQMVAWPSGACGTARVNGNASGDDLNRLKVTSGDQFDVGSNFVVTGWFRSNVEVTGGDYPRLVTKKEGPYLSCRNEHGFDIDYEDSSSRLMVRGQGNDNFTATTPSVVSNWVNLTVVYAGASVSVYANGSLSDAGDTIKPVLYNGDPLTFGGGMATYSLNGQYDEIRIRGGALSSERIKADHDMIAQTDFLVYGMAVSVGSGGSAEPVSSESSEFALSIRHDRIRPSTGLETLTYSTNWVAGGVSAVIWTNGAAFAANLTNEGELAWTTARPGTYALKHRILDGVGTLLAEETAWFECLHMPVVPADVVTNGWNAPYDGAAHGVSAVGPAGTTVGYMATEGGALLASSPAYSNVVTTQVWYEVSGGGYNSYTGSVPVVISPLTDVMVEIAGHTLTTAYDGTVKSTNGYDVVISNGLYAAADFVFSGSALASGTVASETKYTMGLSSSQFTNTSPNFAEVAFIVTDGWLKITKAPAPYTAGDAGDPDPLGAGADPTDPADVADFATVFSAFDYLGVYDGAAHTIDTNGLVAAYRLVLGAGVTVAYAAESGFAETVLPELTDVGATSVWYRVSSQNYQDIDRFAKITITNRPVTITSASADWSYDRQAHVTNVVTAVGLVAGEEISADGFASITEVGTTPNSFSYAFVPPAKASNYSVSVVTGLLTVVRVDVAVTYDAVGGAFGDGSGACEVTRNFAEGYGFPAAPSRADYTFAGWYLSWTNGAEAVTNGQDFVTLVAHTLYAQWTPDAGNPEALNALPEFHADGTPCTVITNSSFMGDRTMTTVDIPVFCTNIQQFAFRGATSLTTVNFVLPRNYADNSEATLEIEDAAFMGASSLTTLYLPAWVTKVGKYAFSGCTSLRDVYFLGNLDATAFGSMPFIGCGRDVGGTRIHLSPASAANAALVFAITNGSNAAMIQIDPALADEIDYGTPVSFDVTPTNLVFVINADTIPADVPVNTATVSALWATSPAGLSSGEYLRATGIVFNSVANTYTITFNKPTGTTGFLRLSISLLNNR
jgi:uncharacterized repeat protein (TIGR02543 family)